MLASWLQLGMDLGKVDLAPLPLPKWLNHRPDQAHGGDLLSPQSSDLLRPAHSGGHPGIQFQHSGLAAGQIGINGRQNDAALQQMLNSLRMQPALHHQQQAQSANGQLQSRPSHTDPSPIQPNINLAGLQPPQLMQQHSGQQRLLESLRLQEHAAQLQQVMLSQNPR